MYFVKRLLNPAKYCCYHPQTPQSFLFSDLHTVFSMTKMIRCENEDGEIKAIMSMSTINEGGL